MTSSPVISVVIPAFNAQRFVEEAVDSVLAQTFDDLEVVVVDDGSTDDTVAVVERFRDPRIHLISQPNQGPSAAVNRGVSVAKGTYLKLLDADDWLNPTHIESQLQAIEGQPHSLASCRWGYFTDDPTRPGLRAETTSRDYDTPLEWIVDSLTRDEGMMSGWRWLIPRSLWDKAGGFETGLTLINDFHFSVKALLAADKIRFAEGAVYSYRKGMSETLSGRSGSAAMESAFRALELGTRLLLDAEDSPRIRRLCADHFQHWLFRFYPDYPELIARTEERIEELGGSQLEIQGGLILRALRVVLNWKTIRRLQSFAYRRGWTLVLKAKSRRRARIRPNLR